MAVKGIETTLVESETDGCISELTPRVKVRVKEGRFSKRP